MLVFGTSLALIVAGFVMEPRSGQVVTETVIALFAR